MNNSIVTQDMSQYVVKVDSIHGSGQQIVLRFPNNFGASIVKHYFSYGAFAEVAFIQFLGESDEEWELRYFESFGDQVQGCDSPEEVRAALTQIMQLEAK